MDQDQLKAFVDKVATDEALQEKLKELKRYAKRRAVAEPTRVAELAKEMGFEITSDQVKKLQSEVTDEELDNAAGGLCRNLTGGSYGTCGPFPV